MNHYSASPLLANRSVCDGYVEWALSFAADKPDRGLVVLDGDEDIAGFACLEIEGQVAEIALVGVSPRHRGLGVYQRVLEAAECEARSRGARELVISTQAHNYRSISGWMQRGWRLLHAIETHHVYRRGFEHDYV